MQTTPMLLTDGTRLYALRVPKDDPAATAQALDRWSEMGLTRLPGYSLSVDDAAGLMVSCEAANIRHAAAYPAGWASVEA